MLRGNAVAEGLEALRPDRYQLTREQSYAAGSVQPFGAPIIHSMNDGSAICFPCGRFSRPVKPYSKPIRYADRLLVLSHDSFERSKKPSPSVSPLTVGVGNNEHPFTMVRGAKGGCGEHFPFRIVPERGQVPHDDLNSTGEQAPDIFDDDVTRADFPDKP